MTRTRRLISRRALVGLSLGLWVMLIATFTLRARDTGPVWALQLAPAADGTAVARSVGSMGVAWSMGVRPGDTIVAVDGGDATAFVGRDLPSPAAELTFRDSDQVVRTARVPDQPLSSLVLMLGGAMLFATLGALVYRWSADIALGRLFILLNGAFATTLAAAPAAILGYVWAGYLTSTLALLAPAALSGLFLYFPRPLRGARRLTLAALVGAVCLAALTLCDEALGPLFSAAIERASWLWLLLNCLGAVLLVGRRVVHGADRRGLSPLLVGTAIGLAPAVVLNALPRVVGGQPLLAADLTVIPVAAIPVAFAYSILRHQVFGLDLLMRRLVIRLSAGALGATLFAALWSLLQAVGLPSMESAVLSAVGVGLALPSVATWAARALDAWLYAPLSAVRPPSQVMDADSLEQLGAAVATRLREVLPVQWSAVVRHDDIARLMAGSLRLLGADGPAPGWLAANASLQQCGADVTSAQVHRFDTGALLLLAGPRLDGSRLDGIQSEAMLVLARGVASAFEAALLRQRADDEARFRAGLTALARDLAAAGTVNEVLRSLTAHAARLLNAEAASLWRVEPDGPREVLGEGSAAEVDTRVLDDAFGLPTDDDEPQREWTHVLDNGTTLAFSLDDGGDQPLVCFVRRPSGAHSFDLQDERRATEMTEHTSGALRRAAERELLEGQLRHRAFYDALTGLPNRALFIDRIGHALARGNRFGQELAVLFIDLDRFKVVNDSLGHSAGDQLLVHVARRLRACLRESDTIARLGGDEFTVLLEGPSALHDAIGAAERILSALEAPFLIDEAEAFAGASIGIAGGSAERANGHDLLREADIALYRAKAGGRGRYAVFEPRMNHLPAEHLHLENDLHRAIERNELRVHYQPIFALRDGRVTGLEALVRWEHPQKGLVLPGHFIPLAEDTGLIVPIGRWVLEEACRQAREWHERMPGNEHLVVSVNLSARQLQDPGLLGDVQQALDQSRLDPRLLQLEITESVVMQDPEAMVLTLKALKGLGIRLAVDDFGTGYSSLAYLKRFPIDVLKIDREFVTTVAHDDHDAAIVEAVVRLARALGLHTTAEGIEDHGQWARLAELGCDQGQGFIFSRPLEPAAITDLLARTGDARQAA